MTDAAPIMNGPANGSLATRNSNDAVSRGLKRRYAAERRFKAYGILAIAFAMGMLGLLFTTIVSKAIPAFTQTMINLEITLYPQDIDPAGTRERQTLSSANYRKVIRQAFYDLFPDVTSRRDRRELFDMISPGAVYEIRDMVMANPNLIGERVVVQMPMSDDIDQLNKGQIRKDSPETERRVKDKQIAWFERLENRGLVETVFNTTFFTAGDSREPELAGIFGAAMGSLFTMLVTLLVSFPLAVASAIYLEEFAPVNKWTQTIEVNINNLAAVPSIVFGLLGLAVFINFFGMPRSAPVVGGLVLALMTLPTIIIAARSALKSVPPSIREAAYGLGASPLQVITHHVLPLAMPGILTGTIIGMAQALGETAPLLMIGMVAFIVDVPHGALDPATVLPVQIYLWADSPERAFVERTSAAICVLLAFLVIMNVGAVFLRKRFERKW
ncbi:MAG: phosphate ABC transporter permease PstA [Alphaproteobacteria bacterium]|nr:phosphate ABC transporter permease PtsA [Rhodospirillaceae bacterium]HCS72008.1 phosphate ABC transporter permease PtsA [Rhodospirillaceae bacterium]|tara:strand:+ start:626 stop:1954 length:1329 start_codon:yes stop_codon:yes gene_type:complete